MIPAEPTKKSGRLDTKKQIEELCKDLNSSFVCLSNKFNTAINCIMEISTKMTELEHEVDKLKEQVDKLKIEVSKPKTYSDVAATSSRISDPPNNERLDRVEFLTSEDERKKRSLEIIVSCPNIKKESEDLKKDVSMILREKLGLENREMDENMKVLKTNNDGNARVILSASRFKRFIYAARKKKRTEGGDASLQNFYINENLTSYNYGILKRLKTEKKRRDDAGEPSFDSVYSYDGRVYAKKHRNIEKSAAIPITSMKSYEKFIAELSNLQ